MPFCFAHLLSFVILFYISVHTNVCVQWWHCSPRGGRELSLGNLFLGGGGAGSVQTNSSLLLRVQFNHAQCLLSCSREVPLQCYSIYPFLQGTLQVFPS